MNQLAKIEGIKMADTPITFTEPAYLIFDPVKNAVRMTDLGILAIFNTKAVAELWASKSTFRLEVRAVRIIPIEDYHG